MAKTKSISVPAAKNVPQKRICARTGRCCRYAVLIEHWRIRQVHESENPSDDEREGTDSAVPEGRPRVLYVQGQHGHLPTRLHNLVGYLPCVGSEFLLDVFDKLPPFPPDGKQGAG